MVNLKKLNNIIKLKGVSLSIQTIIIIVISVLVLAVIVLFFTGIFNPAAEGLTSEANLQKECLDWRRYSYDYDHFDSTNYPGLEEKFDGAITAKAYCSGLSAEVNLEEASDPTSCEGIPMPNHVCCCREDDPTDCDWYEGTDCP